MKENLTELVFILDRSGSMHGKEQDVIGGFNNLLDKQKGIEGEAFVTTVLFDSDYEKLYDRVDLREIPALTDSTYSVRGSTALLDAVGKTIDDIDARLSQTPEPERPAKVIFVITTDGMENASREYSAEQVKNMVEHQKAKYSWEFLFLGADIDAFGAACRIGIAQDRSARFRNNARGWAAGYKAMDSFISSARMCSPCSDWKASINEDEQEQ